MHAHHDVRLLDRLPERIEFGQGERATTLPGGYGRGVQQEGFGTVLHDELELLQGLVEDGKADHGRRVHRVGEVVGPVLEHPAIEGAEDDLNGVGVIRQPFLHAGGERGPDERPVDAHVLHEGQTRLGVEEGIDGRDAAPVLRVGLGSPWRCDPGEGGVGYEVADLVLERDLGAIVDLDVLDDALEFARDEFRQGIGVLVHVVVGIEHRVGQSPLAQVDERIGNVFLSHGPPSTAAWPHAAPRLDMLPRSKQHCWADAQKVEKGRGRGNSGRGHLGVRGSGVQPSRNGGQGRRRPVRQLLSGIKVVELSEGIAGSYCGKLFADLGADVRQGGASRRRRAAAPGERRSRFRRAVPGRRVPAPQHQQAQHGRRCGDGRGPSAAWKRLLSGAHLVIEETGRGRLGTWGMTWSAVHELWPALCVVSISGFGATGPYAGYAWDDLVVQTMSDALVRPRSDDGPVRLPGHLALAPGGQHGGPGCAGGCHQRRVHRHRMLRRLRRPRGSVDPSGAGDHAAGVPVPGRRARTEPGRARHARRSSRAACTPAQTATSP